MLIISNLSYSDDPVGCIQYAELITWNNYADGVTVKVIPVGTIFNGYWNEGLDYKYSFKPSRNHPRIPPWWDYVIGGVGNNILKSNGFEDCSKGYVVFDFDDGGNYDADITKLKGGISYGLWKVEFYYALWKSG